MSIPISVHGSLRGSLLETTLICFPSTEMVSLSTIFTSALNVPSIESYFNKWDACMCVYIYMYVSIWLDVVEFITHSRKKFQFQLTFLTPPLSLTTTTSRGESFLPCQHLRKFLPILPKPLIATFNLATISPLTGVDDPTVFIQKKQQSYNFLD